MLNWKSIAALVIGLVVSFGSAARAETLGTFYGGAGINNDSADLRIDDTPFVLGVLFYPSAQSFVLGFDIAGEGEMLDSTFGSNELRQAYSFNAVIGGNVYRSDTVRTDVSAVIGFRETFADCPDSFLGFQCYADQEPETEYTFNYGAMFSVNIENFMIGLRLTEQSAQALIGISF